MWKIIENYPNYAVSNTGEVKSLPRKNGAGTRNSERILKLDVGTKGYKRVSISNENGLKRFLVHRLVAEAFIPNPKSKPFVNHIDNNPQNNNSSNLEWCTHSENMIHADKQNRLVTSRIKASEVSAKLRKEKVEEELTYLLKDRFIKLNIVNLRTYVHFQCPTCLNETSCRIDYQGNIQTKECKTCSYKTRANKHKGMKYKRKMKI